ncbi:unnamed protein product [Agarophyton chilense]
MDSSAENLETPSRPVQHVVIIGNGHFGASLAQHISRTAANTPYYTCSHTSRNSLQLPLIPAVSQAHILILAIPSSAYQTFVPDIMPHLKEDVIIIDVANIPLSIPCLPSRSNFFSTAELSKLLPSNVPIVKAFNTLSANLLTELNEKLVPLPTNIVVPFAANENESVSYRIRSFIMALGFTPYYMGQLQSSAKKMESLPHIFFPAYKSTVLVSAIVWIWWILYSILSTYVIHGSRGTPSRPWDKFPLSSFMATTAETAITLFAITFLAGPTSILYKKFSKQIPNLLKNWLNRRKQLGLSAFFFASAHAIAGAISASHLDDGWKGQLYFVPGIISYVMFAVLAICSSDASATSLSWAEFRAVFSWLGTIAFAFGVFHQGLWGWVLHQHRPDPSHWVANGAIMPIYWVGILLPLLAISLRILTWFPCFGSTYKPSREQYPSAGEEVIENHKEAV